MLAATARRLVPSPRAWRAISSSRRTLSTATPLPSSQDSLLKVTTLANGVRVASDPTPGHFVAAGVYVDAGSRYESAQTRGAAHMTDRLAFKVSHLAVRIAPFYIGSPDISNRAPRTGPPTR